MNQDPSSGSESMKASDSDNSSASPAASGYSDMQDDDYSSVETSPPPMSDHADYAHTSEIRDSKRYSGTGSVFSPSYPFAPSGSMAASSFPTTASYGSARQTSHQRRPSTSGLASHDNDEAGLAAAVELCNFGTPRSSAIQMGDIPPVPPLPARYASHNATLSIGGGPGISPYYQELGLPPPLTHRVSDERDVKMREVHAKFADEDDEDYRHRSVSQGRSDEYDDGVFGNMEE